MLIVVGAGPAGLMAAQAAVARGVPVRVYDAMGSAGRKFLLAGRGGLNITHAEPSALFRKRYGAREVEVSAWLQDFDAAQLRSWVEALGVETFIGSSGRVFPTGMKAAPLLRAWLGTLAAHGVTFHMRHRWTGWDDEGALVFETPDGIVRERAAASVFALGGASWPRMGSDGAWVPYLRQRAIDVADLLPANCGFDVAWSDHFASRFAGQPIKNLAATVRIGTVTESDWRSGEAMASSESIEGGLVYALSQRLRDGLRDHPGEVYLTLDLLPDLSIDTIGQRLSRGRGAKSWSSFLQSQLGLKGIKAALLREFAPGAAWDKAELLAAQIKQLAVPVIRPRPIAQAISSAGGVALEALDDTLQSKAMPGVFFAGEMLDWEAPTGGYLLTAVMASGMRAGNAAARYLAR